MALSGAERRTGRIPGSFAAAVLIAVALAGCLGTTSGPSGTGAGDAAGGSSDDGEGRNVTDTFSGAWRWPGTPLQEDIGDGAVELVNRSGIDAFDLTLTFRWTDPAESTEWEFYLPYRGNRSGNWSYPSECRNASCVGPGDCWASWELRGASPVVLQVNSSHPAFQDHAPDNNVTCGWGGGYLVPRENRGRPVDAHRRIDWKAVVEYS